MSTFEYCALQYLNQWTSYDRRFVEEFERGGQQMLDIIPEVASFYKVARNFPLRFDKDIGLQRLEPVVKILENINTADIDENNFIRVVVEKSQQIGDEYDGRGALSATTKFLWILVKEPIIIYDKNARAALRRLNHPVREGNYGEYVV